MTENEVEREWSALGKPVDREQWDMTVPTVNAYVGTSFLSRGQH